MATERTGRTDVRWVSQPLSFIADPLLSPITLGYSSSLNRVAIPSLFEMNGIGLDNNRGRQIRACL